ncbi:MAG: hypothetical protein ACPL1H_06490 [bacterium]
MVSWGVIEKNKYLHWLKLIILYVAIFLITHWYLSYYRNMLYALSADEGIFLYGAKRVLDGQIIYRDFFSHFFPGNYYLLALIYKIFGYSFAAAREAAIIIDSFINVMVFYLSYKALKAWYAIIPPLFFMILGFPNWIQFSHYWTSELFLILSLIFFLWYLEKEKLLYLYISGFLIGITTLFLQMPGVYGGILFLLALVLIKRKSNKLLSTILVFILSAAIPLIISFGYIAVRGGFIDFIRAQFFIMNIYSKTLAFNPLDFIFKGVYPANIFIGIYFFGSILYFIYFVAFNKHVKAATDVIIIGNMVLFFTIIHSMDLEHLLPNIPLFLIMLILPFKGLLDYTKQHSAGWYKLLYYLFGAIAVLSVISGVVSMKSNINRINTQAYHVNINGTPLWTFSAKQAYEINEFFPQVERVINGDKNVFVYPYCPLCYVFLNLNNPVFTDMIPTVMEVPNYGRYSFYRAVQDIIRNKTDYIIYCNWPQHYMQMLLALNKRQYHENILDMFVEDNYNPLLRVDGLILYKKR